MHVLLSVAMFLLKMTSNPGLAPPPLPAAAIAALAAETALLSQAERAAKRAQEAAALPPPTQAEMAAKRSAEADVEEAMAIRVAEFYAEVATWKIEKAAECRERAALYAHWEQLAAAAGPDQ